MCIVFFGKKLVQPDRIFRQLKELYQVNDSRGKIPNLQLFLYFSFENIYPYQDLTRPNILILVLFSDIEQFRQGFFTGRKKTIVQM